MRIVLLLCLMGASGDCEAGMSQKPIRYPGTVVSRNSSERQAALQAGAYSRASAVGPSTIGFGFTQTINVGEGGRVYFARVRGLISEDAVTGYQFTWSGENSASPTTVIYSLALYTVELDNERAVYRIIPETIVTESRTTSSTATHGFVEHYELSKPYMVDPENPLVIGAWGSYTPSDWLVEPTVSGVATQPAAVVLDVDATIGALLTGQTAIPPRFTSNEAVPVAAAPGIGILTQRIVFGKYQGFPFHMY